MANQSKSAGNSSGATARAPQQQDRQPGVQAVMDPQPVVIRQEYRGSGKLDGKIALITGGDSGIGRSVAVHFTREGCKVAVVYLEESQDALTTKKMIEQAGGSCFLLQGDIREQEFCSKAVDRTVREYGRLDILVNNAAEQHPSSDIRDITLENLKATFETNVFSMFYFVQAAVDQLTANQGVIINTTSVTAYRGSPGLLDYSATKGAIVSYTRSLSQNLVKHGVRVNAVAPGPIWTPLIPATFDAEKVAKFGSDSPIGRAGEPCECATCYVFLASSDSSYMTGQVLHPNGGEIING